MVFVDNQIKLEHILQWVPLHVLYSLGKKKSLKNKLLDNKVPPATTQLDQFNKNCMMIHLIAFPQHVHVVSASPWQQEREETGLVCTSVMHIR